jgi:succinyl-CoA synthetase alpha subunit
VYRQGVGDFKYYVGISSLSQIATRQDRVCVLNILGGESSDVTPVGHEYSGGNVVFGTSPGRRGQVLETKLGNIPVTTTCARVSPTAIVQLRRHLSASVGGARRRRRADPREPDVKKIFMVTEKMSGARRARDPAMGQSNGIDIFGANCLGVADSWNKVRIGGALGGDAPGEALKKGSIAISPTRQLHDDDRHVSAHGGWGTTTLISSGKDVYIHYAAPEFAFALANDARSKAAVLYVEPGGYYELDAEFTKPVVACVVGRWKAKLTRAVGHAGAMRAAATMPRARSAGSWTSSASTALYTPTGRSSRRRARRRQHRPHSEALTASCAKTRRAGLRCRGKPLAEAWFGSNQDSVPSARARPARVEAMPPYGEQIAALDKQIGALFPRQR